MLREDIWEHIDRAGPDECWPWTAGVNSHGHGIAWIDGESRIVHRLAWADTHGREPTGAPDGALYHTCGNPACCNPRHLEEVEWSELGRRNASAISDGMPRGENHHGHTLTDAEVVEVRELAQAGASYAALGREYGVHRSTIMRMVRGELRREAGGPIAE